MIICYRYITITLVHGCAEIPISAHPVTFAIPLGTEFVQMKIMLSTSSIWYSWLGLNISNIRVQAIVALLPPEFAFRRVSTAGFG